MDFNKVGLKQALGIRKVSECIAKTVGLIQSRWRTYEPEYNYRALCLIAIWELLSIRNSFKDEKDLVYYLFGDQFKKNRTYWNVIAQLKDDSGIKRFDGPKHIELDSLAQYLPCSENKREELILELQRIFQSNDILSYMEKTVIALMFNLSVMEDEREDTDNTEWSVEELSIVLGISMGEVKKLRRSALTKLKPHLIRYS
jgi:hypothetical protein